MGYDVPYSDKAKPTLTKMYLKEQKNPSQHKTKLGHVLVDLVLFDFELDILVKCISDCKKFCECTIMDAWEARKKTSGGLRNAVAYLYQNPPSKNIKPSGLAPLANKIPANNVHSNNMHANNVPANNVTEDKPLDLSALPPADHGEGDEFGSVPQHINPSSYNDDDDNQLIKDSTLLGYRNPPEAKSQIKPSIQPRADPTGYPGGYRPPDWLPPTSLPYEPAVASPNRNDRFDNTHVEVSRQQGQHQHVNARRLGNELGYGNTRPPNMVPAVAFPDDTPKAGGLHSLPSVTVSTNANQFGSSPRVYKRQASIPNDTSLSGGSERMAAIATGTTTNSNQLAVSDSTPVIAAVPIIDQPKPEVPQGPPDSKYGKTNLNALKNRLQYQKEVTQTVVQTGAGPHSQTTSDYVNAEIPYQGVSDSTTKPKPDLPSLRNRLEKVKEVREKAVVASSSSVSKNNDYYNVAEVASYISENPVTIKNPYDKKPMANPRTMTPASSNTHSGSSTSSSKITYRLWQCAHCQTINEAHHTSCIHCKSPIGKIGNLSYFCNFCQMIIPLKRDFKDTSCPRCKEVYETTL